MSKAKAKVKRNPTATAVTASVTVVWPLYITEAAMCSMVFRISAFVRKGRANRGEAPSRLLFPARTHTLSKKSSRDGHEPMQTATAGNQARKRKEVML